MLQLSSEFSPAEITDLCAPASTDYNKEKPPKKDEYMTNAKIICTAGPLRWCEGVIATGQRDNWSTP